MPDAFTAANRDLIIALVARYSMPALYGNNFAKSGGLIAYGPDFAETFRLGAGYVDRILKGANPGELPIQLPTKFELAINLKTAAALGLTIPPNLLPTDIAVSVGLDSLGPMQRRVRRLTVGSAF